MTEVEMEDIGLEIELQFTRASALSVSLGSVLTAATGATAKHAFDSTTYNTLRFWYTSTYDISSAYYFT
jgi:hypothetical protein